jgi:hypothetical protein
MMRSMGIRRGTCQSSEETCSGTRQSSLTCRDAWDLWRVPLQVTAHGACLLLWVTSLMCSPALADGPAASPEQLDFFERKIRPVLIEHCYECHAADSKIIQGGLRVDHRAGFIQGGDSGPSIDLKEPKESSLIKALLYEDVEMPPKGKLSDSIIADFETWIAMGAPDPRVADELPTARTIDLEEGRQFWAFQPIANPDAPAVNNRAWPLDAIDHFILAKQEAAGIKPVADADRYTWLRRVSLDLTGLPPTPAEIDAFIRDNSPHACATVVDRLLESRAFGERWARHWLDLTGYADMIGTSNNVFAEYAWRYRDYLIDAFNKDKPFDRFVREQIAGDLIATSSASEKAECITATGFLMLGDVEIVEPDKAKMEADHIDTQVTKIGATFLGMTMGCVRCHDHKFDPIGVEDYYGVAGMLRSSPSTLKIPFGVWSTLNSTELPETPEQMEERKKLEAEHAEKIASLKADQAKLTEEKKSIVDQLAKLEMENKEALALKATQSTDDTKDPVQGSEAAVEDKSTKGTPVVENGKDRKADDKEASEPEGRESQLASLTKQRDELTEKLKKLGTEIQHAEFFSSKVPKAFAMHDGEEPADMPVYIRGNAYAPGKIVPRGALRVASWQAFPEIPAGQSGRLQLADWLVDEQNPLTARVTVNRIWQKLFGEGLVRSVDYFGVRGETPSHPELLDHLATRFMKNGWSQKQLIRSIILSRVYRVSSINDSVSIKVDPDNRLLWRMHRQRLDAEAIRDSTLAISGELKESHGGPALVLENVENTGSLVAKGVNPPNYVHKKPRPSQEFERTIYLPVMRTGFTGEDRIRSYFDFVNPALIAGQRNQTVVPTQSLFLMNNDAYRKRAKLIIDRLFAESKTQDERLEQLWLRVLSRPMSPSERQDAIAFLGETQSLDTPDNKKISEPVAWQELCHSLLSSNHFVFRL